MGSCCYLPGGSAVQGAPALKAAWKKQDALSSSDPCQSHEGERWLLSCTADTHSAAPVPIKGSILLPGRRAGHHLGAMTDEGAPGYSHRQNSLPEPC